MFIILNEKESLGSDSKDRFDVIELNRNYLGTINFSRVKVVFDDLTLNIFLIVLVVVLLRRRLAWLDLYNIGK